MDRKDLQALSKIRIKEARTLLNSGLYDGAYYLAGYAVERALKACIAKSTLRHDFPDKKKVEASHTHNVRELVRVANLEDERLKNARADPTFRNNWDLVELWSEQSRYRRHDADIARALVEAVNNRSHGILVWIKRHW